MPGYSTMADLIQQVIIELRLESGPSVQQYAEDVIARKIQRIFNSIFHEYWLPGYTHNGLVFTLDGTTGTVVEDLTPVLKRAEDIRYVFYEGEQKPLNRAPEVFNPIGMTGGYRRYWQPTAITGKHFRILPLYTAGQISLHCRVRPDPFTATSEVIMDEELLIAGAVYDYLVDDKENEMAIKKWEGIFTKRESQLRQQLNSGPVPFGQSAYNPLTEWMTNP